MSMLVSWSGRTPVNQLSPDNVFDSKKKQRVEQENERPAQNYDDRICQTIFSLLDIKESARLSSANHYWNRGFKETNPLEGSKEHLKVLKWLLKPNEKAPKILKLIASLFKQLTATPEVTENAFRCLNHGVYKEKIALGLVQHVGGQVEYNFDTFDVVAQGTIKERWLRNEKFGAILKKIEHYSITEMFQLYLQLYSGLLKLSKEYRDEAVIYAVNTNETLLLKMLLKTGPISKEVKEILLQGADADQREILTTTLPTPDFPELKGKSLPCNHPSKEFLSLMGHVPFAPPSSSLINSLNDLPQILFPWLNSKDVISLSRTNSYLRQSLGIYQRDLLKKAACDSCFPDEQHEMAPFQQIEFGREKFEEVEALFTSLFGNNEDETVFFGNF